MLSVQEKIVQGTVAIINCRYKKASAFGAFTVLLPYIRHGKVRYPLKSATRSDGTTGDRRSHVIFEPLDFIARLATLVPKPRVNLTRLDEKHPCF